MYAKEKHHKQGEKLKTEKVSDSLSKSRREADQEKGREKKNPNMGKRERLFIIKYRVGV